MNVIVVTTLWNCYYYYPSFADMNMKWERLKLSVKVFKSCTHSLDQAFCSMNLLSSKGAVLVDHVTQPDGMLGTMLQCPGCHEHWALAPFLRAPCSLSNAAKALIQTYFPVSFMFIHQKHHYLMSPRCNTIKSVTFPSYELLVEIKRQLTCAHFPEWGIYFMLCF